MQLLIKVGSKYPDINDPRHFSQWRDGQVIDVRPDGFYGMDEMSRKHHCVITLPHIDYWDARGTTDWKATGTKVFEIKSLSETPEKNGSFLWELPEDYIRTEAPDYKRRYFIDLQWLLDNSYINLPQFESAYDKSRLQVPIFIPSVGLYDILRIEGVHERLNPEKDQSPGSINAGTYTIGAAGDYATVNAFEADIEAQLTNNLTAEHLNEETAISSTVTFDLDTNTYLLKITAQSGAEHSGAVYGNGARCNYGSYNAMNFDETTDTDLADIEVSKLALDISGAGNNGIILSDCGESLVEINRVLIQGDANSAKGIWVGANSTNSTVRNCTIYGIGNGAGDAGIYFASQYMDSDGHILLYNNTIIKCYDGIKQDSASQSSTTAIVMKNNLIQGCGNSDYQDDGAGFQTTSKNISEDSTSPDADYDDTDVFTNTVFIDYNNDDYRLDPAGDATNLAIVDDGDDLSGSFTDDIIGTTRDTWYIGSYELTAASSSSSSSQSSSQSSSSSSSSNSSSSSSESVSNSSSSSSESVSTSSSSSSESVSNSSSSSSESVSNSSSSSSESVSNSSSSSSESVSNSSSSSSESVSNSSSSSSESVSNSSSSSSESVSNSSSSSSESVSNSSSSSSESVSNSSSSSSESVSNSSSSSSESVSNSSSSSSESVSNSSSSSSESISQSSSSESISSESNSVSSSSSESISNSSSSSSQSVSNSSSSESVSSSSESSSNSMSSSSESVSSESSSISNSSSESISQSQSSSSSQSVSSSISSSSESTSVSSSSSSSSLSISPISEHQFVLKTIDRDIIMKTVSRDFTMKTINRDFTMTDK